jgi:hypothetical protein
MKLWHKLTLFAMTTGIAVMLSPVGEAVAFYVKRGTHPGWWAK